MDINSPNNGSETDKGCGSTTLEKNLEGVGSNNGVCSIISGFHRWLGLASIRSVHNRCCTRPGKSARYHSPPFRAGEHWVMHLYVRDMIRKRWKNGKIERVRASTEKKE